MINKMQPIPRQRTTTSHLKSLNLKKDHDIYTGWLFNMLIRTVTQGDVTLLFYNDNTSYEL